MEWQPEVGQECAETAMQGQYWSNGDVANSIWAITEYGSGIRPRFVKLYVHGDGSVSEDWSAAKVLTA